VIQRFFAAEVVALGVHPAVVPSSVEQRASHREAAMRRYLGAHLQRFRIKPTVFMPALPPLFDLAQLDRLLVGLSDGEGSYTGIGYLEHAAGEGVLRLISPVADPPKALRLGSVRLEDSFRAKRVDLRNLFGTE
jgi:polynucleotide 5'-kinase involved in rRNA processing